MFETLMVDKQIRKKISNKLKRKSSNKLFSYGKMQAILGNSLKLNVSAEKAATDNLPVDGGVAGKAFLELLKSGKIASLPGYAYFVYEQSFLKEMPEPLRLEKMSQSR